MKIYKIILSYDCFRPYIFLADYLLYFKEIFYCDSETLQKLDKLFLIKTLIFKAYSSGEMLNQRVDIERRVFRDA